jgi:Zn-dependent peptidase ImmA (M78 family)
MGEKTAASPLSYDSIRKYAELVAEKYQVHDSQGKADLKALLEKLGIKVDYVDFFENEESSIVTEAREFTIFLSKYSSSQRDRFTVAHELGHLFLHYLHPKREGSAIFNRGGRDTAETQANIFAATLLMPSEHFKKAFAELDGDLPKIAEVFDVSLMAADTRASSLGLKR